MSDWVRTSLGEIAGFKAGNGFPKKHQGSTTGELPFAKVSDMNTGGNELYLRTAENYISRETAKALKAFIHQPGSTAFAKIGVALTTNRRRLLDREIVLDNNMMSAAPIVNRVDPRFFYYLLSTLDFNDISAGSALPYLTASNLKEIEVCHPDIPEQREIATLLGALDDKIELNRKTAATLEAMARALYRSSFVDFDPVHAKAEGRAPAHMDATSAALSPDRFGEDGLPEGWETKRLEEVCDQVKKTVKPMNAPEAPFHHFSLPAFDAGKIPVRENGVTIKSNKLFVPHDAILFSRLNPTIPRVWWAKTYGSDATPAASTEFFVAIAKRPRETPWLYCLLASSEFRDDALARVTGTSNSHQRVPPKVLADVEIISPEPLIVDAFGQLTESWFERIHAIGRENQTLATLRDALLPRLMSGELRVGAARESVEEAV